MDDRAHRTLASERIRAAAERAHARALPVHPVAIGHRADEMTEFGFAWARQQQHFYALHFPGHMQVSSRVFAEYAAATENDKPVHKVWARFTCDGHEVVIRAVMTLFAHDLIHLCAWGDDVKEG